MSDDNTMFDSLLTGSFDGDLPIEDNSSNTTISTSNINNINCVYQDNISSTTEDSLR